MGFPTRFRNFIWFLIFTFTLYCMPNYELLFPYKIHFGIPEAEAAETTEESPAKAAETNEKVQAETSETKEPSAKESSSAATAVSATSSGGSGSSGQGSSTVSFNVDSFTGAAHLSYPIAAPPGRSGLSPQLSLNYVSSGGNGWIGAGWDLSLGHIQRKGPRKGVPKYDDTKDVYELSLGGSSQELVPIGADEYRLKIEGSFLKVKYNSTGNYWEVWDKSGTKMSFGLTVGSRIGKVRDPNTKNNTYLWGLDRVDDPRTNYMELIYFRDQDVNNTYQIYLQKIQYNGQVSGGLSHNHEILFNLESTNRPDPISNYRGGFKALTWKRLSSIEVKTNGSLVRRYQFQYTISNAKSLLSSITLYGSDNTSSLPPTTFTYQTHNLGFNQETLWPNPSAWDSVNGNYINNFNANGYGTYTDVVDMNGDGLLDRVVYNRNCSSPYTNCPWSVYLNNGSGFDSTPISWSNPSPWSNSDGNYIRNTHPAGYGTYTDVIDMNADGLPDRVVYDRWSPYDTWQVYLNNGSGFGSSMNWPNPSAWDQYSGNDIRDTSPAGYGTYTDVIDMNGDGLPDRVVYNRNCSSPYTNCPWSVYLNNGSGFDSTPISWSNPSAWDSISGNYIRDTHPAGYGFYTDVIDMNGDGLPDRVVYDRTSPYDAWKVYFNNGSGFEPGIDWPNPSAWDIYSGNDIRDTGTYGFYTDVIDMNGDGLPDRVVYDRTSPYDAWKVYFNYGGGFGPGVDWPNPSAWNDISGNYIRNKYASGFYTDVVDLNGDGLPDRVVYDKTSPYDTWSVYYNNGPVSDLLSKVENGIGGSTEITYAPSTDYANTFLPFAVQTVSSYTNKDGRGNSYTFEYQYLGGFYDSTEVEFRGFQKVTACQPACQGYESITETTFHQDYYKKGKIQTQKIVSKPPQGFTEGHKKETVNTWLLADTLGGGKFPYLDTSTTTFTDQGDGGPYTYSQTIKDVYDIRPSDLTNQTFNLLEEHKNEGSPEEIVTLLEYSADYTRWIFSKMTKATVTNSSGTIASRKWMDYNTDGELTTEELCRTDTPNTGCASRNPTQNVVTSYQYDPTYKVLNQVTDPRGYVTSITYDSTKTFVYETTKCIEGGNCFTTTILFDPGTGNLIKQTPPHFQGTSYWLQTQYDVLGRKILERMKDNSDPNTPPIVDRGSTSYSYNDFGNPNGQYMENCHRRRS